jgi:small-conductance mechanosensitive channel
MAAAHAIPLAATPATPLAATTEAWIWAGVSLLLALVLATLIDRLLARRGMKLAQTVTRGELRPETNTRLRYLRRLLYAGILIIGVGVALLQFGGLNRLAASLLASGAIAAAIVGFAARQTLANFVAGIMLAITQPLRVGDWVTFEGQYGVVEDVRLNYTILRTPADARLLIPNERLAGGIIRNDTLITESVGLDVAIWLPPGSDAARAVDVLAEENGATVTIAETTPEGIRVAVGGEAVLPAARSAQEAELRLRCLRRLQAEGLLAADRTSPPQDETAPGLH